MNHPLVIIDGIILASAAGKPTSMMMSGNFLLTPYFRPKTSASFVLNDQEMSKSYANVRYNCFTNVLAGCFTNEVVEKLLAEYDFLYAIWENTQYQSYFLNLYQNSLYHGSAYDAMSFALRCAAEGGVKRITHEQLALLTGRNRSTVTKAMHEIALAEPELLAGFE